MSEIQRWEVTEVRNSNGQNSYVLRAEPFQALPQNELRFGRGTFLRKQPAYSPLCRYRQREIAHRRPQ